MRPMRLLTVPAAAALLLAACAGAGSGPTPTEEEAAASSPTESPSASPSPAAAASEPQSLDDEYGGGGGYGGSGGSETGGGGTDAGDAGGGTATVMMMGFDFSGDITVAAGTTVTFLNHDGGSHTVTEGTDGVAVADPVVDAEVPAGGSLDVTFDEPGTYHVTCEIHPTMNIVITVEG